MNLIFHQLNLQLTVNMDELEAAEWFTKDEVRQAFENTRLDPQLRRLVKVNNASNFSYIPPLGSIAYQLIERWLNL